LRIVDIEGDGNRMFRALVEQLDGDQVLHEAYRHMVVDYMLKHPQEFKNFHAEEDVVSYEKYCQEMSEDGRWGDNLELQEA
ncbi:hypothetical protein KI387_006424, partial [Taxus chinensis]